MISLAEPSGSPPTLCAQLCFICQWRVGDAAGGKLSEWELNDTWQNKATALLCRDSLLHRRSAMGEERPGSKRSCVTCPLPVRDTKGSMVSIKKKKNYTKLHFQCSHLTEGMGSYPEAGFASGQIAANCSQCLPSAPVLVYWLVYWAAYLAHSFSLSTGTHTDDTPASQCPLQCALNSTAL